MEGDIITAGIWALAAFDPALVHMAELREHFTGLPEENQIRVTIDRLLSVYVEGQCRELVIGAGITTDEAHHLAAQRLGKQATHEVIMQILDCTSDPLGVEILGYAQHLGALTAHGPAPWNRFAAVIRDCHAAVMAKA